MKQSDYSAQFPVVWASGAGSETVQYPVPTTTEEAGRASLTLGFPPATMTPLGAGGAYPRGPDVNGGFRMASTSGQNYEAGITPPWSSAFGQSIGGYPRNACVADPTTLGAFWISTADDNLTTPGASNAAWQSLFTPVASGRLLNTQVFSASGTYTPTPGTTKIIVTVVGGGGSGGGTPSNNASQVSVGSGGASGSFAKVILTSGFSAGVGITIGAGGRGVASGGNAGSTTTFGSLIAAPGGGFGGTNQITTSSVAGVSTTGPSGAIPSVNSGTPIIQIGGSVGTSGQMFGTALVVLPGFGGSSPCGSGGANVSSAPGGDGTGYGAGGGGTGNTTNSAALAGGSGSPGVVIIEEYS